MRVFIDTNFWSYRLDQREPAKSERVREWLADIVPDHEIVIGTQVLIELRSVASRKLQPPLNDQQISALLEALAGFEVVSIDANLILAAHHLAIHEQLNSSSGQRRLTVQCCPIRRYPCNVACSGLNCLPNPNPQAGSESA